MPRHAGPSSHLGPGHLDIVNAVGILQDTLGELDGSKVEVGHMLDRIPSIAECEQLLV